MPNIFGGITWAFRHASGSNGKRFKRSPLLPNDGKCQSKSPTYSFTWSPMMSFGWWSVWVFYQVTACHCHAPSPRVLTLSDHRGGRRIAGRKLAGGIVTAIGWHTRQTQGWDSVPGTELQSNKKRSSSRNLWNKYTNRSRHISVHFATFSSTIAAFPLPSCCMYKFSKRRGNVDKKAKMSCLLWII